LTSRQEFMAEASHGRLHFSRHDGRVIPLENLIQA